MIRYDSIGCRLSQFCILVLLLVLYVKQLCRLFYQLMYEGYCYQIIKCSACIKWLYVLGQQEGRNCREILMHCDYKIYLRNDTCTIFYVWHFVVLTGIFLAVFFACSIEHVLCFQHVFEKIECSVIVIKNKWRSSLVAASQQKLITQSSCHSLSRMRTTRTFKCIFIIFF